MRPSKVFHIAINAHCTGEFRSCVLLVECEQISAVSYDTNNYANIFELSVIHVITRTMNGVIRADCYSVTHWLCAF